MVRSPSVVVCDDNDMLRWSLVLHLEQRGYRCATAGDGEELLELMDDFEPDLILLDLNMPRMGGLRFLDELRADPMLADSVVFVLTSSAEDNDRAQSYARNVAGYIVKSRAGGTLHGVADLLCAYAKTVRLPPPR